MAAAGATAIPQFGYGGRPPLVPEGVGLGVTIDARILRRWTTQRALIG